MKALRSTAMLAAVSLVAGALYLAAQQGPKPDSSETVAKPKKKDATGKDIPNDADLPKIPSKYSTKDRIAPEGLPTYKTDVNTLQLDVPVLQNKCNFIPPIPLA